MKLQQSFNQHKDDRQPHKNNAYFADNQLVLCVKQPDLEPDPFKDSSTFRWAVPIIFRDENGKQGGKLTFPSSPDGKGKWDAIFGEADEYPCHNVMLKYNVEGNPQKGYYLAFVEQPEAACPCKQQKAGNGHQATEQQEVDAILTADGFQPVAANKGQKKAIKVLAVALRQSVPANLEEMTAQEADDEIDRLQALQVGMAS